MKALVCLAFVGASALIGQAGAAENAITSGPLAAPAQSSAPRADSSKPITVHSDALSADIDASIGVYSGRVVITQDAIKMRADEVKVYAAGGKPTRLEARGNIVFDSPSGSAIGDFGTYDVNRHLITLTGEVVLTKEQNVLHGNKLEVNTDTNVARLFQRGGRVEGLFTPPKEASAAGKPKQPAPGKAGGTVKP